jgi:hypothetical protein
VQNNNIEFFGFDRSSGWLNSRIDACISGFDKRLSSLVEMQPTENLGAPPFDILRIRLSKGEKSQTGYV